MILFVWLVFTKILWIQSQTAIEPTTLIGFDCSSPTANYTPVDLTSINECQGSDVQITETIVDIQVLQSRIYRPVHVQSCLIHLTRLVYHCGMHSHVSIKENMIYSGISVIGSSRCIEIHRTHSFTDRGTRVDDIQANSSTTVTLTIAGSIDTNGNCKNAQKYQDAGGTYDNVVVTGQLTITISDYTALAEIKQKKLIIQRLGISCKATDQYCFDYNYGELVWTYLDQNVCDKNTVDVLYEGKGVIGSINGKDKVLVVKSNDYAFAVKIMSDTILCNIDVWKTEHDRIFIAEKGHLGYKFEKGSIITSNIDLTSYINTKFSYLVHHFQTNLQQLYKVIQLRECETRKMVLEHRLILANGSPDKVGALIEGNGVYGRILGESLYIIKCTPVGVSLRYDSKCYQEIPVTYMNTTMFLTPVTRLLIDKAQEVPCRSLIHPRFRIGGNWYIRTPDLMKVNSPNKLDPNDERLVWEFQPLIGISTGGLYSQEQIRSLQRDMMFPAIREAIQTAIVRKITHTGGDTFDPSSLWSSDQLTTLSNTIASKISWIFGIFGHYASIFIGVYMIWKLSTYLLGVIINCKILKNYNIQSCCLWASLIDSLTTLITIHKQYSSSKDSTTLTSIQVDDDEKDCRMYTENLGPKPSAPLATYPPLQPWKVRSSNFM